MKAMFLAMLAVVASAGCGSTPSSPSPSPATATTAAPTTGGGTLILSGIVYTVDTTGRRPLAGATVELSDSGASWGDFGRPTTDATGRYTFGSLPSRHYLARASKAGYDGTTVINLGFLEISKNLDFELTPAGSSTEPLAVAAVDPSRGSTGGGTTVRITGTGFQSATIVTFDGQRGTSSLQSSTILYVTTPAHAAGAVELLMTNPDGKAVSVSGGYTFVAPQSFDFNGTWVGSALAHPEAQGRFVALHSDMDIQFTIRNNALTSLTCGRIIVPLSPAPAVENGEFSLTGQAVAIAGRIVSDTGAIGTINTAACPATRWAATKQ